MERDVLPIFEQKTAQKRGEKTLEIIDSEGIRRIDLEVVALNAVKALVSASTAYEQKQAYYKIFDAYADVMRATSADFALKFMAETVNLAEKDPLVSNQIICDIQSRLMEHFLGIHSGNISGPQNREEKRNALNRIPPDIKECLQLFSLRFRDGNLTELDIQTLCVIYLDLARTAGADFALEYISKIIKSNVGQLADLSEKLEDLEQDVLKIFLEINAGKIPPESARIEDLELDETEHIRLNISQQLFGVCLEQSDRKEVFLETDLRKKRTA